MAHLRRRLALFAACLLAVGPACVTPSVPIPPPRPGDVAFELDAEAGTTRFSAEPRADFAGAVVYVFNRDQGTGVITTAADDGHVEPTAPFPASLGDDILITFDLGDQLATLCVEVAAGTPAVCDP